jgi:hypothetical protein
MNSIGTIEFSTELVKEYSHGTHPMGSRECSMELFLNESRNAGQIEWIYTDKKGYEDATHIGVWFEGKKLCDYDGVFSLNKYAIKLLNKCGFSVGKEFRN